MTTKNKLQLIAIALILGLVTAIAVMAFTNPSGNPTTGGGTIGVGSNAPANSLYIKSDGNVGIGTTAPGYKLDVNGNARIGTYLGVGGAPDSSYRIYAYSGTSYGIAAIGSTLGGFFSDSDGTSWAYLAYGSYGIYTDYNAYFGGKVGIGLFGTMEPLKLLDVRQDNTGEWGLSLRNTMNALGVWTGIRFGYSGIADTYQKGGIIYEGQDGNVRGKLHFALEGTADSSNVDINDAKMTIHYNGNVGIGTTSPGAKLDVDGIIAVRKADTVGTNMLQFMSGGVEFGSIYGDVNEDLGLRTIGPTKLNFLTNNQWRMTIDSAGNVGIGTASPGAKLEIGGSESKLKIAPRPGGSAELILDRVNSSTNAAAIRFQTNGVTDWWTGVYTGTSDYGWEAGGSNRMYLASTGYLGIGTTPDHKLHVNGRIKMGGAGSTGGNISVQATSCGSGYVQIACDEGFCLCFDGLN